MEVLTSFLQKCFVRADSLDGINDEQLDNLEKLISKAEEDLKKEELENTIDNLKKKQTEQQKKITAYTNEIERLTKEVENIEQIRDSLPDQCFNVVDIEGNRR